MKKLIAAILVVAIIGATVTYYLMNRDTAEKFKTVPVAKGSLRATVTATGTVNAVTTVLVGTQVSGTIKKLHVDFNSHVKKGQVIAEIDPATLLAQVDQAKANVGTAKANVLKMKAVLQDSTRTRDRNRQLFARNLIAKSDLDTSETNNDSNDAQLAAAEATVKQTEAALRFAETNFAYTRIMSPVDGIVVSRNVDVGQTVAASFQTPTLFTIAQDLTKMQIDTNVDEADIGRIRTGQNVEFTVDAYPDNVFNGRVAQVRISPTTVSNVVTYDVVIKVDNEDLRLKPGMTANVSVIVASKDDALKIPNAALRFKPTEKPGTANGSAKPSAQSASGGPTGSAQTGGPGTASPGQMRRQGGGPGGPDGEGRPRSGGPGGDAQSRRGGPGGPMMGAGQPSNGIKRYAVYVLQEGKPKRMPVALGISDGIFTEVVSGDLKEGQEVIVESLSKSKKTQNNGTPQGPPRFIR